jgi:hypothetical protein
MTIFADKLWPMAAAHLLFEGETALAGWTATARAARSQIPHG